MSYQALYRTFRPQTFEDVVGQAHVTKTLMNALKQGKISHAYLFSGPRGTGKTSAAKVFAKTVNCKDIQNGEPCNKCTSCLGIMDGTISDVIEIDAASNNGVEEIRDIRDKVKFAPTAVKYKVYIIDEVHMLSIGAFNALLKTLEEPPQHVIFILATTEPHKLPLTIISRTQRFDFKQISMPAMLDRMRLILEETNYAYEEEAIEIIAKAAEGGMRDCLSLLDQAISFSEDKVLKEDALAVTGAVSGQFLDKIAYAISKKDTASSLNYLDDLLAEGKDTHKFLEDLIFYFRDCLLYKAAPTMTKFMQSAKESDLFIEINESISEKDIYFYIETLNKAQQEMKWTNHPRIYLEVAIVKMSQLPRAVSDTTIITDQQVDVLMKKVEQLETELQQLKEKGIKVEETTSSVPSTSKPAKRTNFVVSAGKVKEILKHATKEDLIAVKQVWAQMKSMLLKSQSALIMEAEPAAASNQFIIVRFKYEIHCSMFADNYKSGLEAANKSLTQLLERPSEIICIPEEEWFKIREDFLKNEINQTSPSKKQEDSIVIEAIKHFTDELVVIEDEN